MSKQWFLSFVYHHPLGRPLLWVFHLPWFSRMVWWIFTTSLSRFLVRTLVFVYRVSLDTYVVPDGGFRTVNDFFIRTSRPNYRIFPTQSASLGSPVDGCIEIFQHITSTQDFCVKGYHANLEALFGPKIVDFFWGDVCFCRLRFSDYHRFHFFDEGKILSVSERSGPLYSVDNDVLDTGLWVHNKSQCMLLETLNFGEVLCLEVGATNVGSIINHKKTGDTFSRGEEKWYFQLGGSAALLVFQKWRIQWEQSLLEKSENHQEHQVVTGDVLGKWIMY